MKTYDDRHSPVQVADRLVPVVGVLRMWGVSVPDIPAGGHSGKLRCVWSSQHDDGGLERTMRVYPDSNSAWCFGPCGRITPVRLHAEMSGQTYRDAAKDLLDRWGIRPLHWTDRVERLARPPQTTDEDLREFAAALVVFVRSFGAESELAPEVVDLVATALADLRKNDGQLDLERWLESWKARVRSVILRDG